MGNGSKVVILNVGIPGSGKSTWTAKLVENLEKAGLTHRVCSADLFYSRSGTYVFDATQLGLAHKTCQSSFKDAISKSIDVIVVDNTNLRGRDRKFYISTAAENGYLVLFRVFLTDPKVCASRNIHGVTEEKIHQMSTSWDMGPFNSGMPNSFYMFCPVSPTGDVLTPVVLSELNLEGLESLSFE